MNEPKKLYRLDKGAMLCGVCGGVAEYFNLDPSLVRLVTAALVLAGGLSAWIYILAAVILPKKSDIYPGY
jgi:phage shock protein C